MKKLAIEWKHLEKEGHTCDRCSDTGQAVRDVVAELEGELRREGVAVSLVETLLGVDRIPESNELRFNGVLLEDLLPGARAGENACCSCAELLGAETSCRTVEVGDRIYEAVSAKLIRQAARKAVGLA
jgi:hypothetical protein